MDDLIKFLQKNKKPIIGGLVLGTGIFLLHNKKKKIFISFAVEDKNFRDLFVGQAKNQLTPFEFVDMSVKDPWSTTWKTQCRQKIKGCHGLIALLSKKTWNADGARWEMKCAREEGIPILGVHIYKENKGAIPPEIKGLKVIEWNWLDIANFINSTDI